MPAFSAGESAIGEPTGNRLSLILITAPIPSNLTSVLSALLVLKKKGLAISVGVKVFTAFSETRLQPAPNIGNINKRIANATDTGKAFFIRITRLRLSRK